MFRLWVSGVGALVNQGGKVRRVPTVEGTGDQGGSWHACRFTVPDDWRSENPAYPAFYEHLIRAHMNVRAVVKVRAVLGRRTIPVVVSGGNRAPSDPFRSKFSKIALTATTVAISGPAARRLLTEVGPVVACRLPCPLRGLVGRDLGFSGGVLMPVG